MELALPGSRPLTEAAVFGFDATGTDALTIDVTRLTFACPLDLAGIVTVAHWADGIGMSTTLKLPTDQDVASYLGRMDVLNRLPASTRIVGRPPAGQRTDRAGSLLEVTPLNADNAKELEARLGPFVLDFYRGYVAPGGSAVYGACGELLSNAVDHGRSDTGGFVAAQTYTGATTDGSRFEFAVCDTGVGVLRRLRDNPKYADLKRDEVAIIKAMKAGVSGIAEVGRGNGLADVVEQTRSHGKIDFRLRSGSGQVRISGSPTSKGTPTPNGRPEQTSGTWAWLSHWLAPRG